MKKILIVDDEKNIRIALSHCLKSEDYDVYMACDGEEAVQKIENDKFDLILVDYQMPNKNGLEVLNEIRNKGILTSVIMMTAYRTVNIAVEAMKFGAIDLISKPFSIEKLKESVKSSLEKDNNMLRVDI
ncbi:MAG: response regulator [Clostridium sp.]|uniref:response regulator n=1 Tax=Clostridium sp. TaxID=1506 RepID=UPI003F3EB5C6